MAVVHVRRAVAVAARFPRAFWPIVSLILFGIAFGYLEASVVVYLRSLHAPLRLAAGLGAQDLFPLLRLGQLPPETLSLLKIELGREAATLIMIAAVALAVARSTRTWLAAFILVFGIWDVTFYLWLRVLIGWPASVFTWDILFLLPVPWAAPVLAPSIVAATMAAFGALLLARQPDHAPRYSGFLIAAGAVVQFTSFIWDWQRWMNGGMPQHFPWALFGLGEALLVAGLLSLLSPAPQSQQPSIAEEVRVADIGT